MMRKDEQDPIRVAYERRNKDLDPQLIWRGKDKHRGALKKEYQRITKRAIYVLVGSDGV